MDYRREKEMKINVRRWKKSDLPAIYDLMWEIPAMDVPPYEKFVKSIKSGRYPKTLVAAKEEGKPLGMVIYSITPMYSGNFDIFVDCIAVDEDYRRMGVGRALLGAVKKNAQELGAEYFRFCVFRDNTEAQKFYEKMNVDYQRPNEDFLMARAMIDLIPGDNV
jgi:ribosomal protein S18 acetylase RimI-like enzyme